MANHQEQTRQLFHEEYRPTWKLHVFNKPVWIVEYTFDDSGPTDFEFDIVAAYAANYVGLTRTELRERLDTCGGFTLGRPYSSIEVMALKNSGLRISLTKIKPGNHLISIDGLRYFLVEDEDLREELAAWMISEGATLETLDIE